MRNVALPDRALALPQLPTAHAPLLIAWGTVVALFLVGSKLVPGFFTLPSVVSVLILSSILGIASAGQTMVVVLGGIDLSIAAVMTLADVMIAQLTADGWPIVAVLALVAAISVVIGGLNGFVSRLLRVHPLIITLGVGFMITGALQAWTGGNPQGSAPAWITTMVSATTTMGPIRLPPVVAVWAVVAAITVIVMRKTVLGRQVYALGSNPAAAELALVRPRMVWTAVFSFSALVAAVAGTLLAGYTGFGDLTSGDPYLFNTVAAVVVGGTSLLGGRGGYAQTIPGALILIELQIILVGIGLGPVTQQMAFGLLILVCVAIYGRERHIRFRT